MAKHHRVWNEAKYRQYLKEGRGQGTGANYIPWILIQDFASKGMVSRVKGAKTERIHHLLSNNELRLFSILDMSEDVLDIREQYPLLNLADAIEIAETAQIRYPYDSVSGFPYVMTSDFYLETKKGMSVISVKSACDLNNLRVLEKLEVERRYWLNRGVNWQIATEKELACYKQTPVLEVKL